MDDLISRQAVIDAIEETFAKRSLARQKAIECVDSVMGFARLPSAQQWIPVSEPPDSDRSVFIAYGNERLKSCCIGYYDSTDKQWREQKNFFATLIYDAKYWCDMPELPERWYE